MVTTSFFVASLETSVLFIALAADVAMLHRVYGGKGFWVEAYSQPVTPLQIS